MVCRDKDLMAIDNVDRSGSSSKYKNINSCYVIFVTVLVGTTWNASSAISKVEISVDYVWGTSCSLIGSTCVQFHWK